MLVWVIDRLTMRTCHGRLVALGERLVLDELGKHGGRQRARTPYGGQRDLFLECVWQIHVRQKSYSEMGTLEQSRQVFVDMSKHGSMDGRHVTRAV